MPPVREPDRDGRGVSRRTVLRSVGVAGIAAVATSAGATAGAVETGDETANEDGTAYSVVQGDTCFAVDPLSGSEPVEELYGLRIPRRFGGDNGAVGTSRPRYTSAGTTDLQRQDVTITFLYDGPDGLSLVVVHDSPESEAGGAVTFTVRGAADAAWAVKDDLYTDPETGEPAGSNYDNWDVDDLPHTIDWTWGSAGTDGGALRASGDDLSVGIDPSFNDAAALWGEHYAEDPITDWQFLSFPNGRDDPERTSLSREQEVTVRSGKCDGSDPGPLAAAVDVKPGSDENPINPDSNGVTPVAVRSSDDVDAGDVDVGTLRFGPPSVVGDGDGAEPEHGGHEQDDRLVLHFPTDDAGFESGNSRGKVVGETDDGRQIAGTDDITIVGDDEGNEEDGDEDEREKERENVEGDDTDGDDGESGPPEHAGPPEDGKGNGPPEHAGPPDEKGDEDDEDDEDEDGEKGDD